VYIIYSRAVPCGGAYHAAPVSSKWRRLTRHAGPFHVAALSARANPFHRRLTRRQFKVAALSLSRCCAVALLRCRAAPARSMWWHDPFHMAALITPRRQFKVAALSLSRRAGPFHVAALSRRAVQFQCDVHLSRGRRE
jgi:hypothetical protein